MRHAAPGTPAHRSALPAPAVQCVAQIFAASESRQYLDAVQRIGLPTVVAPGEHGEGQDRQGRVLEGLEGGEVNFLEHGRGACCPCRAGHVIASVRRRYRTLETLGWRARAADRCRSWLLRWHASPSSQRSYSAAVAFDATSLA